MKKILTYVYVHGGDETMWMLGEKLGLKGEALSMFSHAADEFKIGLEVDPKTGIAEAVSLDGREIVSAKK